MFDEEYAKTMHFYFHAVLRLRQDLRQRVQRKLTEHGHSDITLEMTQVLYYLHYGAKAMKANQQEIANKTGKNKSSVTSLLDNLVKRGLVERVIDKNDRRHNVITLTVLGTAFVEEIYDKVYRTYDIAKIPFSIKELQHLTDLLNQLMDS
ncbi:MarR family winged helix-turn-helix transcriptional regulator [Pedobacter sp.]|uniref:MarR family winged helix-turn-helix transcriptional regulator n=1 Tax=Pedobacter sp. TaxID=1411316 RepID=UPI003D7FA358